MILDVAEKVSIVVGHFKKDTNGIEDEVCNDKKGKAKTKTLRL